MNLFSRQTGLMAVLIIAALVVIPTSAFAHKKNGKWKGHAHAAASVHTEACGNNSNGNGLGKGGVPALRNCLNGRIDGVQAEVDAVEDRATQLETDVSAIQTDLGDVEGDVATLQGEVLTLQGDVSDLEGDVLMLKGDVFGLQTEVAANTAAVTDGDGDFWIAAVDCDDTNPDINPGAEDASPSNGIDEDCDGVDTP